MFGMPDILPIDLNKPISIGTIILHDLFTSAILSFITNEVVVIVLTKSMLAILGVDFLIRSFINLN